LAKPRKKEVADATGHGLSKPAAESQPKLNAGEVLKSIGTLQRENLKLLDDDIAILQRWFVEVFS